MRLYLPASPSDLASPEITVRVASAVTPALAEALPEEDQEGLEHSAFLTAADLSALDLAAAPDSSGPPVPARRCVLAVEVSEPSWQGPPPQDLAHLPSVCGLLGPLPWSALVSIHLDEEDVAATIAGLARAESDAWEELAERDMLWFDAAERSALVADLG